MGSVNPPHTIVVNITIDNVVDTYKSVLSPGMFCDSAKAMAPLKPANQIAIFIFGGICWCRNTLANEENGKLLSARANKQKNMHKITKNKFHFRNRPVKNPIPIYKYTKNSLKQAIDLKM